MEKTIHIVYDVFENHQALPTEDKKLFEAAREAASRAYAPYSKFQVGAAVLLSNGAIVCGSNQENMAYPSGLCAERVAVFSASSNYPQEKILAIAINVFSAQIDTSHPVPPCGACRQVLMEYEMRDQTPIRCIFGGSTGKILQFRSIADLLPLQGKFI